MNVDELWQRLGLDSLASTAVSETFGADATLRSPGPGEVHPLSAQVRLSLTPPPPTGPSAALDDVMTGAADLVVLGELGAGGMGTVLQARQPALARDVAVKIPRRDSPSLARSLVDEARLAGSLEHPGIVPVHAIAFDAQGSPGLVMRLVDGVAWSTLLHVPEDVLANRLGRQAPNRLEQHLYVFLQVCNAIAFAHSHGVLHRDLKPANVLIGTLGEVYVFDWGVARRTDAPPGSVGLKGTPAYFAPEMCTGDDTQMDERTDVFLLGAVLYEVIQGHPPYARAAGLREAIAAAWVGAIPPLPESTPDELDAVVMRALAHDKAARFSSVRELRDAVAAYLRHAASHRVAASAQASLDKLRSAVSTAAPREVVGPLSSECRFGFMHALSEWPENPAAREGLEATIRQCISYELVTRHPAAARGLLHELKVPAPELVAEVEKLEAEEAAAAQRAKRIARVTMDFDPKVAIRQRAALFVAMAGAVLVATFGPVLVPAWGRLEADLERWQLLLRMVPSTSVLIIGVLLGRRGLMGTRLNRRFIGFMALSLGALTVNRFMAAAVGITPNHALLVDLVLLGVIGAAYSLTFYSGFLVQSAAAAAGVAAGMLWPGHERLIFSSAVVVALLTVLVTWTRWRSELEGTTEPRRR